MSTQKVAFQLVLPFRKSWMARALSIGNKFRVKGKVGNSEGELFNIAIKSTTVCTVHSPDEKTVQQFKKTSLSL